MGLHLSGRNARLKLVLLVTMAFLAAVTAAIIGYTVIQWATNGEAWFTAFGYTFHKISFLVGLLFGSLFVGGGSVSR